MVGAVIDASVAVKWFLLEDRSTEARALIDQFDELHAPTLIVTEVVHALWSAARQDRTSPEAPQESVRALAGIFPLLTPDLALIGGAARLMRSLQHPIHDCLYLALGAERRLPVITADERLYAAGRKARIAVRLL